MDIATRNFLDKLHKVKEYNGYWSACCPVHEDVNPSFLIWEGDSRLMFQCYKCGDDKAFYQEVCDKLGIAIHDLRLQNFANSENSTPKAIFQYYDEEEQHLFDIIKYNKKLYKKVPVDKTRKVLYNLPSLVKLQKGDVVYLTEGEKDANTLKAWGLTATTNPFGASSWSPEYNHYFKGLHVVILQDMDIAGVKRTKMLIENLAGIAESIKVIKLPNVPVKDKDGEDITDWKEKHGGTKEEFLRIVENTPLEKLSSVALEAELESTAYKTGLDEIDVIPFPKPIRDKALIGVIGDVVRLIEPTTEASREALLFTLLTMVGNYLGKTVSHRLANAEQAGNLFIAVVGKTGQRKGTSYGCISRVFKELVPEYMDNCIMNGLSSGEGLIERVRNPRWSKNSNGKEILVDEGARDKRALVLLEEFVQLFEAKGREGNTLSAIIRGMFDGIPVENATRNNPIRASGHHVSLIGHITPIELKKHVTEKDAHNGFANRFLYVGTKKSKSLPGGGNIPYATLQVIKNKLDEAFLIIETTLKGKEIILEEGTEAFELWKNDIYPKLERLAESPIGHLIGRGEVLTRRLATIYAAMDGERVIRSEHLDAAFECYMYSVETVKWVFGTFENPKISNNKIVILEGLYEYGELSQTQISNMLFGRGKKASSQEIAEALKELCDEGKVEQEKIPTDGKAKTIYRLMGSFSE